MIAVLLLIVTVALIGWGCHALWRASRPSDERRDRHNANQSAFLTGVGTSGWRRPGVDRERDRAS